MCRKASLRMGRGVNRSAFFWCTPPIGPITFERKAEIPRIANTARWKDKKSKTAV
jgi:hypothetical protein